MADSGTLLPLPAPLPNIGYRPISYTHDRIKKNRNWNWILSMDCWICGSEAKTGEHIVKRSDLALLFRNVTQAAPIFLQKEKTKNLPVGSFRSEKLKHSAKICAKCNNSLTQPHDNAWQSLLGAMRAHNPKLEPGAAFRAHRAFPNYTHRNLLQVHLFFLKAFGCMIKSGDINIPLAPFANAILRGRAHPNVYLKFGSGIYDKVAGVTDMWTLSLESGEVVYATWIYRVGRISVNLVFAREGEKREGLVGAWHPRQGTAKLRIADFQ